MMNKTSQSPIGAESIPLHELIARLSVREATETERSRQWFALSGTWQPLNQRFANQPLLDFFNYSLRGIGQVMFVNNPVSGLLILVALFVQSSWVGIMSVVGVAASTLMAIALKRDRYSLRNGIFGYNGILVGATLATFGAGNEAWISMIAAIVLSALTTLLMETMGIWFASKLKCPPLTLPSLIAALLFLRQPPLNLETSSMAVSVNESLDWFQVAASLPLGFAQVFSMDKWICGVLVLLAVAFCTPIGAAVGVLGSLLGILAGLLSGASLDAIYAGLWSNNAALMAMAIGGVFYVPNLSSILIGAACAFFCALLGGVLGVALGTLQLPVLTLPFCLVTIACFPTLHQLLRSLVPIDLHAIASTEEHRQRYRVARDIITNFRLQLEATLVGKRRNFLFERASAALKGDLRYIFDAINCDHHEISIREIATHLYQAGQFISRDELVYLFQCVGGDGNNGLDFEGFGELMLRHRRLMSKYTDFLSYFLPSDALASDTIGINEMDVVMASVGEPPLSEDEITFLQYWTGGQSLTWNRFIEVLLVT